MREKKKVRQSRAAGLTLQTHKQQRPKMLNNINKRHMSVGSSL